MISPLQTRLLAGCLVLVTAISGCVDLKAPPDPTRYYLLNGADSLQALAYSPIASGPVVRLAPIKLDPYLDTPYMVIRVREFEVQFSDINRWGEDLSENIRRALARNLVASGDVSNVVLSNTEEAHYVLRLHVHRFEGVPPNIAHLSATWRLTDAHGEIVHEAIYDNQSDGWQFENYAHLAEKLDESLADLAAVVVERIR